MQAPRLLFTSESVTEGHPDKLCDQISDAILDAFLGADPESRVACEAATTTGLVLVLGEITSKASFVDVPRIVRDTVCGIGYNTSRSDSTARPAAWWCPSTSSRPTSRWALTKRLRSEPWTATTTMSKPWARAIRE